MRTTGRRYSCQKNRSERTIIAFYVQRAKGFTTLLIKEVIAYVLATVNSDLFIQKYLSDRPLPHMDSRLNLVTCIKGISDNSRLPCTI